MFLRRKRCYILLFALFILFFCIKVLFDNGHFAANHVSEKKRSFDRGDLDITAKVTVIARYAAYLKSEILTTVSSLKRAHRNLRILIVSDHVIPKFNISNVHYVHLDNDLLYLARKRNPLSLIKTPYVYFPLPGTDLNLPLNQLWPDYKKIGRNAILLIPGEESYDGKCQKLELNLKEWTAKIVAQSLNKTCDLVTWDFGIIMERKLLEKFPDPFGNPFPEPLFFQANILNTTIKVSDITIKKKTISNFLNVEKIRQMERTVMYDHFGIKKVVKENVVEWYGCNKNTSRCFGSVVNSTPDYLWRGRWTPPCCLKVLRETGRHVIKILQSYSIRYWLEGGSLLGAMRNSDIIPWDYDIDIGLFEEDLRRHPFLRKLNRARNKKTSVGPFKDAKGYVWELAPMEEGGNFFRVQASSRNRLHVDLFPFRSRNGLMVRPSYLKNHPQDRAFPEIFLKPLTTISFIGLSVFAPNNIRDFLELKFGKGCIENPKYPNIEIKIVPN